MRVGTVDVNFGEEGKADAKISLAKGGDVGLGSGFLMAELVAGEAEDGETAILIGGEKRLQSCVLRGIAALAGGVDDEQDVAVKGAQTGGLPVQKGRRKTVDRLCGVACHRKTSMGRDAHWA